MGLVVNSYSGGLLIRGYWAQCHVQGLLCWSHAVVATLFRSDYRFNVESEPCLKQTPLVLLDPKSWVRSGATGLDRGGFGIC